MDASDDIPYHDLIATTRLSPPVDTSIPYDVSRISGKTILITGGALGLGAALARHWASHGANLVIGDINDAAGEKLIAELRTLHPLGSHHYAHCDVTDWDSQVGLFKEAARRHSPHGGIDVVVANAGINDPARNWKFEHPAADPADPDAPSRPNTKIIDVNVTAAMHTAHLAMFWLPRNGAPPPDKFDKTAPQKGTPPTTASAKSDESPKEATPNRDRCLILLGSIAGLLPFVGQVQYTTSKHAMTGLFRALRGTAWTHGIRVNLLCPYFISGSNMMPRLAEAAFLSGGAGGASLEDFIDASTRLVADENIVGRALVVGPKVRDSQGEGDGDGAESVVDGAGAQSIWDCYAEDYKDAETFIWRWVRMLNAVEKARGWFGVVRDLVAIAFRRK